MRSSPKFAKAWKNWEVSKAIRVSKSHKESGGKQLSLLPVRVLIDECVPHPWDLKTALESKAVDATVVHEHNIRSKNDSIVSITARKLEAIVITTDYKFNQETITQGEVPPDIIWISRQQASYTSAIIDALKEITEDPYPTCSGNLRHFTYCSPAGVCRRKEVELPPPELQDILVYLDKSTANKGLSNVDLRNIWNCSRTTAWRRASKLVIDGWLHKVRKGREIQFFRGPKLKRFCDLGSRLRRRG